MLRDALRVEGGPVAIRFPKGAARDVPLDQVGSGLAARQVTAGDGSVCIVAVGRMLEAGEEAVARLASEGVDATLWDARLVTPLDPQMLADAARHQVVVTVEDGIRDGGVGTAIVDQVTALAPTQPPAFVVLGTPVEYVPHGKIEHIHRELGLDADGIAHRALAALAGDRVNVL